MHHPCDAITSCINLAPGFRCEACPDGFDGNHVNGYYAQSLTEEYSNQVCSDVDECALGNLKHIIITYEISINAFSKKIKRKKRALN